MDELGRVHSNKKSKNGLAQILRAVVRIWQSLQREFCACLQRKKDVLAGIGFVGREIDPFFVVVIEGVVEVQTRGCCSYADVDSVAAYQLVNKRIDACDVAVNDE